MQERDRVIHEEGRLTGATEPDEARDERQAAAASAASVRSERRAQALRANLVRRKTQSRGRSAAGRAPSVADPEN